MESGSETEIRYGDLRAKIVLQPFLHKRAGELQDEIFRKVSMMIYGMERCDIVHNDGGNTITITLGNCEKSSYSAKLGKILEAFALASLDDIEYIEVFDRRRDESGNVIRENPRIDDYNNYLVNKSADEYDHYFDDMIEQQSSQMYHGIDSVISRLVSPNPLPVSLSMNGSAPSPFAALQQIIHLNQTATTAMDLLEEQEEEMTEQQESILNIIQAISQSSIHSTFLHHSLSAFDELASTVIVDPEINPDDGPLEVGGEGENDRPAAPEQLVEEAVEEAVEEDDDLRCNSVLPSGANRVDGNLEPMPSISNPFQPTILESRLLNAIINPFNQLPVRGGAAPVVPSFFPSRFYTFNFPTVYNTETVVSQLGQQIGQQMEDIKVTLSKEEYEAIPTKPFGECSPEEREAQPTCIICSDNFVDADQVKITKCHHIIHDECLRPWLLKESKKCPVCRCELAKGVAHLPGNDDDSDSDDEVEEENKEDQ